MAQRRYFASVLVEIFAARTRAQRIYKPLLVYLTLVAATLVVETFIKPPEHRTPLVQAFLLVFFVSAPFTVIAFAVISHLERLQNKLAILASTDLLTELPNRREFLERLRKARSAGDQGTLILLDADHFKRINDTYGHAVGDACLQAIAARIRDVSAQTDTYGRIGGEEFCIYLRQHRTDDVTPTANALISPIRINDHTSQQAITLTLSAGIARAEAGLPVKDLLQRADEALYTAKNNGRAQFVIWNRGPPDIPQVA